VLVAGSRLAQVEYPVGSSQKPVDDVSRDIGQAEISSLGTECQTRVVDSQAMQDRRLQIVNVDFVLDGMKAEFIGRPVGNARLDSPSGHPHRKTIRMMIPAPVFAGRILRNGRSAELASSND